MENSYVEIQIEKSVLIREKLRAAADTVASENLANAAVQPLFL